MQKEIALLSILLLTGCGSSPKTHFYTLSAAGETGRRSISFPVQLVAVHLPPSLDRKQMVRMTSENTVKLSETDRWLAALDEMTRNVLAQDLMNRLEKDRVILPESPAPPDTATLVVTITHFGPKADGTVRLSGGWSLVKQGTNTALLDRQFKFSAAAAATADATASTMSDLLGRLADQMASSLSRVEPRELTPAPTPTPSPEPSASPTPSQIPSPSASP